MKYPFRDKEIHKLLIELIILVAIAATWLDWIGYIAEAQPQQPNLIAEVSPAPVGYLYRFTPPFPNTLYGFRDSAGKYYSYQTLLKPNGTLLLIASYPAISTAVTTLGAQEVKTIYREALVTAIGIRSSKDVIIYGGGLVFTSILDLYYDRLPPYTNTTPYTYVISEMFIDYSEKVRKILAIPRQGAISVRTPDGFSQTLYLSDLIQAPEVCVTWFPESAKSDTFPWSGGIAVSPACTENIEIKKTVEYIGRPYAVLFSVKGKWPVDLVLMSEPRARELELAGLISKIQFNPSYHVIPRATPPNINLYVAASYLHKISRGFIVDALDATITLKNSKVCPVPEQAEPVYRVMWRDTPMNKTFNVLPGEVFLYKYRDVFYVCFGDLEWIEGGELPIITSPSYSELMHPVYMTAVGGRKFVAVLSNGAVFYGDSVEIPIEGYTNNKLFVLAGGKIQEISVVTTSIFFSVFFIFGVLIAGAVIGIVLASRGKPPPERIKIVFDVKKPEPVKLSSEEETATRSRKHLENFGYCPSDIELSLYYGVLMPLKPPIDPSQETLVCPEKTNIETEAILRDISWLFLTSFWAVKRLSMRHGYIYTRYGDQVLFMFMYKQEEEKDPGEILMNALIKSMTTYVHATYKISLGLLIIVSRDMVDKVKREIKLLEALEEPSEEVGKFKYDISRYLSYRSDLAADDRYAVNIQNLQSHIDRWIPNILVISSDNVTALIEYLADKFSALVETYMKARGVLFEEKQ